MNLIKKLQNSIPMIKESQTNTVEYYQEIIHYQAQQEIIKALKKQMIRLQEQNSRIISENIQLLKQVERYRQQSQSLQQKFQVLKQNNQSLMQTFQVFQNEFVKRRKRQNYPLSGSYMLNECHGPFHLEIIRTVKSMIINTTIEPAKAQQKSQFYNLYNYFFQQNCVQQQQVELFNQLAGEKKRVKPTKIKGLGKKNFFNQRFRHMFWFNVIENKLKLTNKYYGLIEAFLQENVQNRPPKTSIIDMDIKRMDFRIDQNKTNQLKAELKKLLSLFQIYRPDIGYVQGMNYIGWMFLIRMNPINSFIVFSNVMLTDPFVSALYAFEEQKIKKIVSFFQECLSDKKPKLFKYTQQLGVDSQLFIIEWAYTFYSRAFSLKLVSKIWDLWFSQGFNVFFRVAMTVFEMLESELLLANQSDKYIDLLKNNTFKLDESQFLKNLSKQKLFEDLKFDWNEFQR